MRMKAYALAARSCAIRLANGALSRIGLRLSRGGVNSALADVTSPIEAYYRTGGREFLWNAPLDRCRILHCLAFSCTKGADNPFIDALVKYERSPALPYLETGLAAYYDQVQPATAAEALGLQPGVAPILDLAPALAFAFPWSAFGPDVARQMWLSGSYFDTLRVFRVPSQTEWKAWGPVARELGELEFSRLTSVYRSIRKSGYRRSNGPDGDIGGILLADDSDYAVQVSPGHHRISALAALGHERAPIRIRGPVVHRSDVANWPNVANGVFPVDAALRVFDRIMAGRQPWSDDEKRDR